MLDLLWKHDLKDYIPRTNYTMSSIARMPYTNNWRVGDIRRDCVRCTVPNTSGQNGVEVSYRVAHLLRERNTGILSEIGTNLCDWAVWQARAGCCSQAALSSNDSKTLYVEIKF